HHVRLASNLAASRSLEYWSAWAQCFEGILLIKRGNNLTGSQLLQSAIERLPEPSFHYHMSSLLAELAAGLAGAGQIAEGLVVVDKALARAEQTEAGWCLAELLRTKGELLLLGREPTAVGSRPRRSSSPLVRSNSARHQPASVCSARASALSTTTSPSAICPAPARPAASSARSELMW